MVKKNLNKIISLSTLAIILGTLFYIFFNLSGLKEKIIVKYPNLRFVKYLLKGDSLVNKISNDYKVKFLPYTEFEKLKLIKKEIKFKDSYYSPSLNSAISYKKYGTFFIEPFKEKLILVDYQGNIYSVNYNKEFLRKSIKKVKTKNIKTNLELTRAFDSLIIGENLYISHTTITNDCQKINISFAKIDYINMVFQNFFQSDECYKDGSPSRMQFFNHRNKNGILLSTSGGSYDKPGNNSQNKQSLLGKIIFIELKNRTKYLYSYGHRVIQGLYAENDLILATEHGPKAGDEINKIVFEGNYGWPIASYGEKYNFNYEKKPFYKKNHYSLGFVEPLYSFIPAVGISEIIRLPNNFSDYFQDKFIVSSLYGRSIFIVHFDKDHNRVINLEKIFINERIRDIKYDYKNKNILLAFEENGEIGILSVD
jgi:hypothetical protein